MYHLVESWFGSSVFLRYFDGFVSCLFRQCEAMGCIKSKEEKGPTMKYRPENSTMPDPNATATTPHVGHYGPDPTQLQQNQPPSSTPGSGAVNFNHTLTPFGGSSSAITPFGGASTSFTGPVSNSFSGAVSSERWVIAGYLWIVVGRPLWRA